MEYQARRLTDDGVQRFEELLVTARATDDVTGIQALLQDPASSEPLACNLEISSESFPTRYALIVHLVERLEASQCRESLESDPGFWAWLTVFYFDLLTVNSKGKRSVGDAANYILSDLWGRRRRHALRWPYVLVKDLGSTVDFMLSGDPATRGEIMEQILSRQQLFSTGNVFEAAARLYRDPETGRPKRGASSKGDKPGTVRRFGEFLGQIALTYDIPAMGPEELLKLLPPEFERFAPEESEH